MPASFIFLCVLLFFGACGIPKGKTLSIGPRGGSFETDDSVKMKIPGGAVERSTQITIEVLELNGNNLPSPPNSSKWKFVGRFGPSGHKFKKRVLVSIPLEKKERPGKLFTVAHIKEGKVTPYRLNNGDIWPAIVGQKGERAHFFVDHFSDIALYDSPPFSWQYLEVDVAGGKKSKIYYPTFMGHYTLTSQSGILPGKRSCGLYSLSTLKPWEGMGLKYSACRKGFYKEVLRMMIYQTDNRAKDASDLLKNKILKAVESAISWTGTASDSARIASLNKDVLRVIRSALKMHKNTPLTTAIFNRFKKILDYIDYSLLGVQTLIKVVDLSLYVAIQKSVEDGVILSRIEALEKRINETSDFDQELKDIFLEMKREEIQRMDSDLQKFLSIFATKDFAAKLLKSGIKIVYMANFSGFL